MTNRIGQIATVSGRLLKPLEATPDEIHIEDIAQALSLRCRYNCQIPEFYSVAQHVSMGVSTLYVNKCSTEVHDIEFARAWFFSFSEGPFRSFSRVVPIPWEQTK